MPPMPDLGILAIALLAGALIGCIGIGGVLLVPALVYLAGTPIHAAIAAAMFSYLFSGAAATWVFARKGSIDWMSSAWLALGAVPGGFAGAFAAIYVAPFVLEAMIAALVLLAGFRALQRDGAADRSAALGRGPLIILGASVGFGSAMTGTGGPLLLVPLLVWLRVPILATIGLSQAIQLPIAALATVGNLLTGQLDLKLGLVLGAALTVGSLAGARLAHVVPTVVLTRFVGALMLAVGVMIVARLLGFLG
jgi:uncharacterized membrane protein YfcA